MWKQPGWQILVQNNLACKVKPCMGTSWCKRTWHAEESGFPPGAMHTCITSTDICCTGPAAPTRPGNMESGGALVVDAREVHVGVGAADFDVAARGDVGALAQREQLAQLVAVAPQVVIEDAGRARVRQHVRVAGLRLLRREGPVLLRAVCANPGARPRQALLARPDGQYYPS